MKNIRYKLLSVFLVVSLIAGLIPTMMFAAPGDTVSVTKKISADKILEGGELEVQLEVQGSPPVNVVKPNDVILIIDKSGSMLPSSNKDGEDKMTSAKEAAKGFIDLMDLSKHRVGIVDYQTTASTGYPLTDDANSVKSYIDTIRGGGGTGTGSAIVKAQELLADHRPEAQPVIVLMTDGEATGTGEGLNAYDYTLKKAKEAKDAGIVFYTIALLGKSDNPDNSSANRLMKDMATTSQHHHFVLGSTGLAQIYKAIVEEIGMASAYDVVVKDIVSPEFEIVPDSYKDNIPRPTVQGDTLIWNFGELKKETLVFKYKIRHKAGAAVGTLPVGSDVINVTYKDYSGAAKKTKAAHPSVKVSHYAPVINSLIESSGLTQGGETVIIEGEHFLPNPKVTFGTVNATDVQYIDSTKIIVKTPANKMGVVDLTVTNTDNQKAKASFSYYAFPEIAVISPDKGPMKGENEVVITGKNFVKGALVSFGDANAQMVSLTETTIRVKAPAHAQAETVSIKIVNPDGREVTLDKAYTYVEGPSITSVTPVKGLTLGAEEVTITGLRFVEGAKLYFGTNVATVESIIENAILVKTPSAQKAGKVDIKVINPDGQENILSNGYEYIMPAPKVKTVTPSEGLTSGNTLISIKGEYFVPGSQVFFNDQMLSNVVYYSGEELKVRTPQWNQPTTVDIKIVNPDKQEAMLAQSFTYVLPNASKLTDVQPTSGPMAGGTVVSLIGENFTAGMKIYLDQKEVMPISVENQKITLKTPSWGTGEKVDIKIIDVYGRENILSDAFEFIAPPPKPAPIISQVTPDNGPMEGGTLVTITGTNFAATSKIFINGKESSSIFYGSTDIRTRVPSSSTSGKVNIKVVNEDGQEAVATEAYTYNAPPPPPQPEITSVTPDNGPMEGGTLVTITGANFAATSKIFINGKESSSIFYGSTDIRTRVPSSSTSGKVNIKVVNEDGQEAVATEAYTYNAPPPAPAPEITSITPNEGLLSGGYMISVKGANFKNLSQVSIDGASVQTVFYSSGELRARVPAGTVEGLVDIKVANEDSQEAVLKDGFKYVAPAPDPAPEITELTPNRGDNTGNYLVSVKGNHFTPQSKAYIDNVLAQTTFYGVNELRVRIPASSSISAVDVKVVNGDGQEVVISNGFTYQMPAAPEISSISPNEGLMAGGYYVTIKGVNYTSSSKVYVDDKPVNTIFYNSTELRAQIPATSQPGKIDIKVQNNDGQVGVAVQGFTYLAPPPLPAPVINSITPNNGVLAGGYTISVKGANFNSTSKAFVNKVAVQTTFYSVGELRIRIPASTVSGSVDIEVVNGDGQSVISPGAFTYNAPPPAPKPIISSITPNSGSRSGGYMVTVKGANFTNTSKAFVNGEAAQTVFYSAGDLRVRIPASSISGAVDFEIINGDQSVVVIGGFTYN